MKKTLVLLLLSSSLATYAATTNCFNNHINEDMCTQAAKMAMDIRPHLPLTMSERIEMYSIESQENKLIAHVKIDMSEEEILTTAKQNHIPPEIVKTRMAEQAKIGVCEQKNPIRSFIRLGGEMQYIYTHPSGKIYNTVTITSCE
ncbi:hypothetical protein CVW54_18645 [Salmonella enterica]|nr:hypothetical protein [Salmonella enterica]EDN2203886.1 hypothetical protein [Salmonella enterica]EIF5923901.1 hypothetical protein [Salmonella enterica]EIF8212166.1 hypothetical protein [Salmonella enterica]ELJ2376429.1 hypothetical protein [Salmonella enterica]